MYCLGFMKNATFKFCLFLSLIIAILLSIILADLPSSRILDKVDFFNHPSFLLFFAPVAGIVMFFVLLSFSGIFKAEARRKQIELDINSARLNDLVKGKLHSIRSNYNTLTNLINEKKFEKAELYALETGNILSYLLNTWQDDSWTLADELNLLESYNQLEKILDINVKIIASISGMDPVRTPFMQDVFFTLFKNSIEHGFKSKPGNYTFTINGRLVGNVMHFEVTDNGIPSAPEAYNREEKPNRGLNLLKRRIENEFLKFGNEKMQNHYAVETVENVGTTIKFMHPKWLRFER